MAEPALSGPAVAPDEPVLAVHDLEVCYGAVQILFGTSLQVRRGESLALLGTNGAGKSTLLKAITGLVPVRSGAVRHRGADLAGLSAEARVRRGITLVSGGHAVFRALTVEDNL